MSIRALIARTDARIAAGLIFFSAGALALRHALLDGGNSDMDEYLEWLQFIRDHGGVHAFKYGIGDYTPFFPYLLWIADSVLVGARDVVVVKSSAIVADFVCAAFVYRIVRLRYRQGPLPLITFGVILFTPTVFINSAYWGQTDMLWVAALVAATYYLLVDRSLLALVLVGIAFAVKQQPVFLGPFLLVLVLKRKFPWWYFLAIPVVYGITIAPAVLEGRSTPIALAKVYLEQADKYTQLTLNAPTVYQWLPEVRAGSLARPGAIWGAFVLALLVLAVVAYLPRLTPTLLLALATASVLTTPYVLPRMHERYFFAADVFTIILAFYVPKLVRVALIVQLVSFFSYWPFLFEEEPVPEELLAFFELIAIVSLLARGSRSRFADSRRRRRRSIPAGRPADPPRRRPYTRPRGQAVGCPAPLGRGADLQREGHDPGVARAVDLGVRSRSGTTSSCSSTTAPATARGTRCGLAAADPAVRGIRLLSQLRSPGRSDGRAGCCAGRRGGDDGRQSPGSARDDPCIGGEMA